MGDRAPASVTVYACPPEHRLAALETIQHYDFGPEFDTDTVAVEVLELGHRYVAEEVQLGIEEELGTELEALGCSYEIHQDGRYEFDGVVRRYTPDLGPHTSTASNDGGDVLVREQDIELAIIEVLDPEGLAHDALPGEQLDELIKRLHRFTGKAWRKALAAMDPNA